MIDRTPFIESMQTFLVKQSDDIISLIISSLEPDLALQLLSSFPEEKQKALLLAMAAFDSKYPSDDTIKTVIKNLENLISILKGKMSNSAIPSISGKKSLLALLEQCDKKEQTRLLNKISTFDKSLSSQLKKEIITIEDLLKMPDHSIQMVLRNVSRDQLIIVLKNNKSLKDAVFKNLNKRSRTLLNEDIEFLGPVTIKQQKQARLSIVAVIRELAGKGVVVIPGADDDGLI